MKIFYKKVFIIFFLSLVTFVSAVTAGNIKGTVTYHDLVGVDNVVLSLYDSNNNFVATTTTNAVGNYIFTQMPYGIYTLKGDVSAASTGVDMTDAWLIEQYLLGNQGFFLRR